MQNKCAMFLLGSTLAFGLSASAYIISQAAVKVTKNNNIRVKGSSMRLVESDFAHWDLSFNVTGKTQNAGLENLKNARITIEKYLKANGINDNEITFGRISMDKLYESVKDAKGNTTSVFKEYSFSQSMQIASPKVHLVEKLSRESTSLIKHGFDLSSCSPSYTITDLDKFKMELLAEATKNATDRAEVLAKHSKGKVGALLYASQGIFQITAPASSDISSYGEYDKSTIMKEIKAVVTLEFGIDN